MSLKIKREEETTAQKTQALTLNNLLIRQKKYFPAGFNNSLE